MRLQLKIVNIIKILEINFQAVLNVDMVTMVKGLILSINVNSILLIISVINVYKVFIRKTIMNAEELKRKI